MDRITKTRRTRDTPSIQRDAILEQDRKAAAVFSRDHGDWAGHLIAGETALDVPEIGISVALAELYPGVEFTVDAPSRVQS